MLLKFYVLTTTDLLVKVSQVSALLPVIAGLINYKKLDKAFRILLFFFVLCIGFEIMSTTTNKFFNSSMPGLHLYTIVRFLFFSVVFYHHFRSVSMRRVVVLNAIVAFLVAVADASLVSGILHTNTLSLSYIFSSLVVYTLIYVYQVFRYDTSPKEQYDPMFWFAITVLIFFADNLLYFGFREYLLKHAPETEVICFRIFLAFNTAANFLFAHMYRSFSKWKTE